MNFIEDIKTLWTILRHYMNDLNTIALNEQIFRKHIFIFSRELKKEFEDSSSLLEKCLKRRENLYLL